MHGEFRVTDPLSDAPALIVFGPRDLAEARAGVPQAAIAILSADKQQFSPTVMSDFLNAALAASHGNFEPMINLCPPKTTASTGEQAEADGRA